MNPSASPVFACALRWLGLFVVLTAGIASGRSLRFHGPVIQWHEDPATTASFSWVEQIAPDSVEIPLWKKAPSGFGYGDNDDLTELGDMRGKYERVYLATTFRLSSVPRNARLELGIRYDDAFIAYINGREVARSANIEGSNAGAEVTDYHEAGAEETFPLRDAGRYLRAGENLISIEGHNAKASSSDFTLEPRLILGGRELVRPGDEWLYMAGGDPTIRWHLQKPSTNVVPPVPMEEESEWALLIRRRGSGDPFKIIPHDKGEFGNTGNPVFRAKVTRLAPATAYQYELHAGKHRVKSGWFRTAPAHLAKPMRFVVGGDMGTRTAIPMCRAVAADDPEFVAIGGDLAYANGRAASLWYEWMDNWVDLMVAPDGRSIPIMVAIGNHEVRSFSGLKKTEIWKGLKYLSRKKNKAPFFYTLFDLPGGEPNYTVDFGNYMSFVVLDSGYTKSVGSQTPWLRRQLGDRLRTPHIFVLHHRPAWGTGIKENSREIQRQWCPLFEKYQTDCVFENDHHVFKRSHPITAGVPDKDKGILYLGDGAWGATLRPITPRMLSRSGARNYLAKWDTLHHVWRVTISPDGSRHYQAFDTDRRVFDSFRDSTKRRAAPPANP